MKRIFDIVFASIGLIVTLPVFLIISLLVIIDSSGGVFYVQQRVGKNFKEFSLLKFRTMKIGSEKRGLLTVGERDSRITKIGFYLRKFKLDELPQLINVLIGDMSFVGPRPEVMKYVNLYSKEQRKVFTIKPGITDFASIKFRNENELLANAKDPEKYYIDHIMPKKLALNIEYITKNNLVMDIRIILYTLSVIFRKYP